MEGTLFWSIAVLAAVFIGLAKGGLPVMGMLSVPLLTLILPPVTAAGLLLPVYVVSDVFGLYAYRHAINRRVLAIMAPAAALGVGLGWLFATTLPDTLLTGFVGLIGTVFALSLLTRRGPAPTARPARVGPGLFWGMLSGLTSFLSHAGAPPYQVYVLPLRMEKTVFAGTTTVLFAVVNAVKLVPYAALGQLSVANLNVAALLVLPAVLAVFAGVWLVRILPEVLFYRLVTWALLAISLKHLLSAVFTTV
ncbi:MAG: sulfite exporter TauE/SafE family protein [Albidovulum sp.]